MKATHLQCLCVFYQKEPPAELLTSFDVPQVSSIHFHNITPCSNHPQLPHCDHRLFPLREIPLAFELDDIKTNFVTVFIQQLVNQTVWYVVNISRFVSMPISYNIQWLSLETKRVEMHIGI
jgi:hypothetical protein